MDSIDNIKGIPGSGPVAAKKILTEGYFWDVTSDIWYRDQVFNAYIKHFGEYKGIQEFHKNYMSLKLLESYEGFVIPEVNKLSNNVKEEF